MNFDRIRYAASTFWTIAFRSAIAAGAVIRFAERHAALAEQMAASDPDPARRAELEKIAAVCRHVPAHAPRDFWEAIQAYWFTHLGVVTELNTWWTGENSSSSVLTTK